MSSTVAVNSETITLNFAWKGPKIWSCSGGLVSREIEVIDLVIKGLDTLISVYLPLNPSADKKIPFTCRTGHETTVEQVTHPTSLQVTKEQMQHLLVRAGICECNGPFSVSVRGHGGTLLHNRLTETKRKESDVYLEIPKGLEIGQTYRLEITSNSFEYMHLSATLIKE